MDSTIGIKYKGGVVFATDQNVGRSIVHYQRNMDKIIQLTSHSLMACSGPNADVTNFTEFVSKNIALYEISHDGVKLSTAAQANFARTELAKAIRKGGAFEVNALLGGYDAKTGESDLYFLDYLGTLHKVNFGCQGYASYFVSSTMDREYKEGTNGEMYLDEEAAISIMDKCIHALQERMLINQSNFIVKAVDKDGVRVVKFGSDPAVN